MSRLRGKTAEESEADTSLLSRRLFASPPPRRMVGPILGVSLLAALFLTFPAFSWDGLGRAFLVLAASYGASAVLTLAAIRGLRGRTFLRRTTLQAFVDACTMLGFVGVVALAQGLAWAVRGAAFDYDGSRLLYLGFAATAWLRHAVWISTADHRHARTVLPSAMTFLLGFLAVKLALPTTPSDDALALVLFLVFLAAGIAFAVVASQPIRHAFNVNGLRLMRHLLDHMTDQTEEARRELEAFFETFAQPAEVRTAALALRPAHGPPLVIAVTHAHPGPFGVVAGSDLPAKLRAALADVSPSVLVPHGPSTHDYNPATSAECAKVAATVRDLLREAKPVPGGSEFTRATVGKATATAQFFGDVALVTASLAPNPTDDIDGPTGHAAIHAAKDAGARDCLFVDAHNWAAIAEGTVRFGSEESLAVIEAAHRATRAARARPTMSLRAGLAEASFGRPRDGAGAQGLQVLVVEADGQRTAYLQFDGNNMVPGLRDEVRAAVQGIVDDAEVLTTDNHSVNATMGGFNPVGMRLDRAGIVALAADLVGRALAGLRPVESAAASGVTHGLRVFGHENTARLTSSVNATISILRPIAVLTMGLALAASVALLVLVP